MGIFVIIILLICFANAKKKEKLDITFQKKIVTAIAAIAIWLIMSSVTSGFFSFLITLPFFFGAPIAVLAIIIGTITRSTGNKRRADIYNRTNNQYTYNQQNNQYAYNRQNYQQNSQYAYNRENDQQNNQYAYSKPRSLDRSAKVRYKIIRKFNKIYDLMLTDSQIECIVNASYVSPQWANEIAYMQVQYDNLAEWYGAPTGWLRAYIKVFYVQEINSDFSFQEQICFDTFNQIFNEVDFGRFYSVTEAIKYINNKYMIGFDDITFMIAYRFLEQWGRKYTLPGTNIIRNEDKAEKLAREYQ